MFVFTGHLQRVDHRGIRANRRESIDSQAIDEQLVREIGYLEEFALHAVALLSIEAGMIRSSREVRSQRGGCLIGILAGRRVNDGGTARVVMCCLAQQFESPFRFDPDMVPNRGLK